VGADSCVGTGAVSCAGADSWLGADSCAGADSWLGADSGLGEDSCEGADSCEGDSAVGVGSGVVLARGTWAGGWIDWEDALELWCLSACEREPVVPAAFAVLPGKALAATSANTPVSATEPAASQRLARLSLRRAASLEFVGLCGIASGDG
jgi:hypothetical protein